MSQTARHDVNRNACLIDKAATRLAVVNDAREAVHRDNVNRVGGVIVNYLTKHGTSNESDVRKAVASRDRQLFGEALAQLKSNGVVVAEHHRIRLA